MKRILTTIVCVLGLIGSLTAQSLQYGVLKQNKNVLEDFTRKDCGYYPMGHEAINRIMSNPANCRLESMESAWGVIEYIYDETITNRVVAINQDGTFTYLSYNEKGLISSYCVSDSSSFMEYEYNDEGILTGYKYTSIGWGGLFETYEYIFTYDAKGQFVRIVSDSEGTKTEFAYNAEGLVSEKVVYYAAAEEEGEGTRGWNVDSKETYAYENGNLVRVEYYSVDWETGDLYLVEKAVYEYDAKGNCVTKEVYSVEGETETLYLTTKYYYDETIKAEDVYSFEFPESVRDYPAKPSFSNILVKELTYFSYYDENLGKVVDHSHELITYNYNTEVVSSPLQPINLTAEAISATEVELSWLGFHDAEYFSIYEVFNDSTLLLGTIEGSSCTIIGLETGTEYCFAVAAVAGYLESELSETVCIATEEIETPVTPEAPTNLRATVEQNVPDYDYKFKVTMSWDYVPSAESYDVYIYTSSYPEGLYFGSTAANEYIAGSNSEMEFWFSVRAVYSDGSVSDHSETCHVILKDENPLTFLYEGNDVTNSINNIVIEKEINEFLEIQFDLVVGNSTANDMNVVCEIENLSNVGQSYVVWGSCYPPSATMVTNKVYAGEDATFNGHVMFIDEEWNELPKGTVIPVRYTFYDESNPSEKYVFNVNYIYSTTRNVLIEEFTGRDCVYCPMGHAAINDVMAENPGKVFAVNYHTLGVFSPTTYPNLNVTESSTFFNAFNISGTPSALVNRNNAIVHPATEAFNNNVNSQLSQLTEVKIEGNVAINPVTRQAEITVELDYLSNSNYSTNYLTIMMLQDSIFGSQSGADQSNPEQIVDGQYCHMHVLRDVITNTWGDAITPTTAGTHITKTYIYEIPEVIGDSNGVEVDLDNIYFLAFVTEKQDGTPTRPVLNVNKLENLIGTDEPIHPYIKTFAQEDVISCDKTKKFTANVVNGGTEVITSLKFEVKVAGGATTTEEWEGYLPAYENTNIDLFAEVPWGGAEVSAKIVEANGETFTFEISVMAFSEEWIQIELDDTQATEEFKLELAQDRFGNQITWKVIGHNDEVIANGGPYKMLSSSGIEVHEEYFTIPAGECARFIIEDNVGNGINGSFGNGYYKLYDSKGNILIDSDGDFGSGEEHVIYVNGNGEEQTPMVEINVTEVTTTSVNVSFTPAEECASYFIMLDTEANMEHWTTAFEVPLEQLIEVWGIERTGASTNLWDELIPNTEYTIFVLSKNIEGEVIQLDKKKVTTLTPGGEGISVIDLQVEVTSNTSVYVVATPNEETAVYHYIIADKAYIESIGIDSTLQLIHNDPYVLYGVDRWEWIDLTENTEYYAIAQGKNIKGEWGEITIVEFVTTVGETPKDPVTPQSPLTFLYEGNDVTNSINNIVIEKEINEAFEIQFDLVVGNNTANDMNVVCEKEDLSNVGQSYICWGNCYMPGTTMATNTVYAGGDDIFNGHAVFYDEDWNELPKGTVIPVRYTFYDESNPSEQYVFNVKFIYENDDTANYWTPDESLYANNMTIITTVEIDGEEQYNPSLELGAFCNGELRGSARLQYVDSPANRYECFLMVYGNSNDIITFQLYDHSTGKVSELTSYESIAFEVNATIGDVTNPYTVNFIGSVIHSRDLTSGWNWYSTYIINEGAEGLTNLETAVGTNGIQIKNQTKFVNQASGNWYGTLTSTAVEDMFMIQMSAAHTLNLEGYVVNPAEHPITLGTNWKWISYPLAAEMSVEEAFASANPSNGDYVKSQKGFAQYYEGLGWSGTLKTMTPGMGYMYQNTSGYAKTLVYPMANAKSLTQTQTQTLTYWDVDVTKYPMNMTVIAVVEDAARDYEVAAFSNGECRGAARPVYIEALGQSMIFMTVYGDDYDNVSFRYYDVTTGEEVALNEEMTFEVNATHGDVMEPYVMTLSTMGIDETSAGFNIYPNPVQDKLYIETEAEIEEIVVYDVYGRVQNLRTSESQNLKTSVDVTDLNSGVYFVKVVTENGNIVKRIIKN